MQNIQLSSFPMNTFSEREWEWFIWLIIARKHFKIWLFNWIIFWKIPLIIHSCFYYPIYEHVFKNPFFYIFSIFNLSVLQCSCDCCFPKCKILSDHASFSINCSWIVTVSLLILHKGHSSNLSSVNFLFT